MKTKSELDNRSWIRLETLGLHKALAILLTAISAVAAFGQGKVRLVNNSLHLVYWPPGWSGTNAGIAYVAGQGGVALTVELWSGTSSTSLSRVAVTDFTAQASPGTWNGMNVTLPTAPGLTYFQINIYDIGAGYYLASSGVFTAVASGTIAYNSLVNHNSPANSTWADGTYNLDSLSPGFRGALALWGCEFCVSIDSQPRNQTVVRGGTATFAVGAHVGCSCVPLSYQWMFNGVPIPGATSQYYQISNVQPANAGHYAVHVWDVYTDTTSSDAILTVLPVPPALNSQPQSQTAELGASVGFQVGATGDPPLIYQWLFNGTYGVSGVATNPALNLTNVQFTQTGSYSVVVSNLSAAVTSPPAFLNVIAPVERKIVPAVTLLGQSGDWLNLDYASAFGPIPNWTGLDTVALTNTAQWYFDTTAPLASERFYRAWQTNVLSPPPALDLHLVPAITLTGAIGSSVRIDYINQFGPVNTWATLDTVTLTSSPQLYFDTSSIGQPQRLYRLVP